MYGLIACAKCLCDGNLTRADDKHHVDYETDCIPLTPLCREHHSEITNLNTALARMIGYRKLDKEVRRYFFDLWLHHKVEPIDIEAAKAQFRESLQAANVPAILGERIVRHAERHCVNVIRAPRLQ